MFTKHAPHRLIFRAIKYGLPALVLSFVLAGCAGGSGAPTATARAGDTPQPTLAPPPFSEPKEPITPANAPRLAYLGRLDNPFSAPSTVFAHAFSPDGTRLVGLNNDLVLMWNLVTGRVAFSMQRRDEVQVFFSPFKDEFYTLSSGGFINVHNVADGAMLNGMSAGVAFSGAHAYDSERGILVLGGDNGNVQAWNLEARTSLATFRAHETDIAALTLSADGTRLATASESGEVRVWDVSDWLTRTLVNTLSVTSAGVTALAFSPDNAQLTVGTLAFVETFSVAEARTLYALAVGVGGTSDLMRYSPDGKSLMTGGGEADLTILSAQTGAIVAQLNGVQGERISAAFNASGELMVTTAYEKSITLWNLSQATETTLPAAPLRLGTTRITSVDWTADGFLIAFFDANGSVYLWGIP